MNNKKITKEEKRLGTLKKRVAWLFIFLGVLMISYGIFIK